MSYEGAPGRFEADVRGVAGKLRRLANIVDGLAQPKVAERLADLSDDHPDYPRVAARVINEVTNGVAHLFLDSLVQAAAEADREVRS